MIKTKKLKPVPLTNLDCLTLIHQRAKLEHRSLHNALVATVLERLGSQNQRKREDNE